MKRLLACSLLTAAVLGCSDATPTQSAAPGSASFNQHGGGPPPGRGGPPSAGTSTGYEIVTVDFDLSVLTEITNSLTVTCPTGKRAVNGGVILSGGDGEVGRLSDSQNLLAAGAGVLLDGGQRWGVLVRTLRETASELMMRPVGVWAACINS